MNTSARREGRRVGRGTGRRFRRGSVLIVVLVVIVLLTYGVYGFTERMIAEAEAANSHGRAVQASALAESGVEVAASLVDSRLADPENPVSLYHQPGLCGGIVLLPSTTAGAVGRFSLVAPVEADDTYRQVRFGLADESGKLNVNSAAALEIEAFDQQTMLMYLPGMTEEIADAILDYVDEDEEVRTYGAEAEYYTTLTPPSAAKNKPLDSIDELLLVRGVTPELLYGEDANRNGLLDPAENDGAATPPIDDGDGVLNVGWGAFLTVHGRESNISVTPSDTGELEKKIHINQGLLTELYDAIIEKLDDDPEGIAAARFIVAYRMYGPTDPDPVDPADPGNGNNGNGNNGNGNNGNGNNGNGNNGNGNNGNGNNGNGNNGNGNNGNGNGGGGNGGGGGGGGSGGGSGGLGGFFKPPEGDVTRGGLDLSGGAQLEIKSLYDLIDREVYVPGNEEKQTQEETIPSPWSSGEIVDDMPMLLELFSLTETDFTEGRVNVNEARREVLLGLPNMTPAIADAIVAARASGAGPVALDPERRSTGWLVAEGIVDLPTMRKLDPYLTARGDVFKAQAVGFFDGGGPTARVEAVIDGTVSPAKVVAFRDLSDLGRGYAPTQLLPGGAAASP